MPRRRGPTLANGHGAEAPRESVDSGLAEGEHVGAHAGVEERELERPLADRPALADELVHPRLVDRALARLVDVEPVIVAGRTAVEERPEAGSAVARRQDQVEVAALEAVGDRPGCRVELGGLRIDGPLAPERPRVEPQPVAPLDPALAAGEAHVS